MYDSLQLWRTFCQTFFGELKKLDPDRLTQHWHNKSSRTIIFEQCIQRAADQLHMSVEKEFMALDFVLRTRNEGAPVIVIESENDIWTVDREIAKLCSTAAPLRILITVSYWNSDLNLSSRPSERQGYLQTWAQEFQKLLSEWEHPGSVAVIVGERSESGETRFYPYLFVPAPISRFEDEPVVLIPGASSSMESGHGA